MANQMNEMKRTRPQEFWKLFKKKQSNIAGEEISIENFQNYFKTLASDNEGKPDEEVEHFMSNFNMADSSVTYEELDTRITQSEIRRACKQLNTNKACSIDNILYEYLKESIDVMVSSFEILFNYILETGDFPKNWSKGLIVPIYKEGNPSDPSNYRGIALISCFAKLFTVILNNRLKDWAEKNSILTDAQFGFRSGFGTVDAAFSLNSIIERQFNNRKKLFACFIDFRKAYDLIDRNAL